jgi:hypothetical protein
MTALTAVEEAALGDCHVLIACSKSKQDYPELAQNMYVSPLYRKSVLVAKGWGVPFSILSAKHGLLQPNQNY